MKQKRENLSPPKEGSLFPRLKNWTLSLISSSMILMEK
jgi:hypothetical protein